MLHPNNTWDCFRAVQPWEESQCSDYKAENCDMFIMYNRDVKHYIRMCALIVFSKYFKYGIPNTQKSFNYENSVLSLS